MVDADLSVIVCTRDRPAQLATTLANLRASSLGDAPLIVYDDASAGAAAIREVLAIHPGAVLIRGDVPRGPTGGRNACLRAARTPFCLVLDDDVYPLEVEGLASVLAVMRERPEVAVIGLRCRRVGDGELSPRSGVPAGPALTFHGGASLLRRDAVLAVGGYRELLFFGGEDTDLALTLRRAGWVLLYEPTVIMAHEYAREGRNEWLASYLYARNRVLIRYADSGGFGGLALGIRNNLGALMHGVSAWFRDDQPQRISLIRFLPATMAGVAAGLLGCLIHHRTLRAPLPPGSGPGVE